MSLATLAATQPSMHAALAMRADPPSALPLLSPPPLIRDHPPLVPLMVAAQLNMSRGSTQAP